MCRSKDDPRGPYRCGKQHGSRVPLGPLSKEPPADYSPTFTGAMRAIWGGRGLSPSARRLYYFRDVVGYKGYLNQDGYPCDENGKRL